MDSGQTGLTAYLEDADQINNEFVVRAVTYAKKNKKITIKYSLALTDETSKFGTTARTGPLSPEGQTDAEKGVLTFVLVRDDHFSAPAGSLRQPINLIGRVFLSTVMYMAHTIAYVHKKRDMRFMSKGDGIGSYAVLTSNIDRKIHDGDNETNGVLDFYVAWRLEALASYLASLHSATSGAFRDQLVLFYESDMFANEFAYYSGVISNYVSSQSVPEEQVEAVSGPRSIIKEPTAEEAVTASRFAYTKSVEPETVYYRLDSSLLRLIYRDYVHLFYAWYTQLAQDLDLGVRNLTTAGASPAGAIPMPTGKKAKKKPKYKRIQPTNAILKQMWPLVQARSVEAIESGAVRPDVLLRAIAEEVVVTRQRINLAVPLVPMSTSFIDFGALLSDPRTYALPPSTNATHVREFMVYLEGTFFSSYDLVGRLAARVDIVKTTGMTQDQLVKEFANRFKNFREVRVLNRFRWPASGHLIRLFREYSALPPRVLTELAATEDIPADEVAAQATVGSTAAPPTRRVVPTRTQPVPLSMRQEPQPP